MAKTIEERRKQQREHKKFKRQNDPEWYEKQLERTKKWSQENKEHLQEYYAKYRQSETLKYKTAVYDLLGRKCVKCGYKKDIRALQIDHINGGGRAHHRRHSNYTFYKDVLKDNGEGYQVLCANCNVIKKFDNNETPRNHKNSMYALQEKDD